MVGILLTAELVTQLTLAVYLYILSIITKSIVFIFVEPFASPAIFN